MKKILIVIGTRPEAIKMAPVITALEQHAVQLQVRVCATAQHRQMLDQVFEIFKIGPQYDLDLMRPDQDIVDLSARILLGVRDVLEDYKPDLVLVHGDTTTSVISALAAFYQHVPVAHVEAGLRTYDIAAPWPEEMNRQITGRIAAIHFSPTETAKQNLIKEGVPGNRIFVTGNTVIDALQAALKMIKTNHKLSLTLRNVILKRVRSNAFDFEHTPLILVTGHRRENFGRGFVDICKALGTLADHNPETHIIYPVHLNPNVRQPVNDMLGQRPNIHLIEPLAYLPFLLLMDQAHFILTDSGGLQEEAPSLGKPVLVMRETTERPEAVASGTVRLVGTDREKIISESQRLLDDKQHYLQMSKAKNPYGDGTAACTIAKTILSHLAGKELLQPIRDAAHSRGQCN